jgi:hypothetical protein
MNSVYKKNTSRKHLPEILPIVNHNAYKSLGLIWFQVKSGTYYIGKHATLFSVGIHLHFLSARGSISV